MKTLKDYLEETIRRYGATGSNRGMSYTLEQGVAETISPTSRARNAAARDYETDLLNKDNEWKQTWLQKTIDFANKTGFQIKTNPSRTKAIFINKQLGFGLQAMVKNYARSGDGLTVRYGDLDGKDNFNTDLAPDEFHDTFVRLYKDAKAGRVDQGHKFPTQNQFDPEEPEQKYLRSFLEQDDVEEGWKQKVAGAALAGAAALSAGGAQAQSTDKYDSSWGTSGYDNHIRSDRSLTRTMGSDPSKDVNDFQQRIQSVTGPNAKGEYKVVVIQGNDIVSHYITKTPPPGWLYKEDAASNDPLLAKAVDLAPVGALEESAELRLILQRAKLIE